MNRRYTKEELHKHKCLPTQEEVNNLPYNAENAYVQIPLNLETGVKIFYCSWNKHLIYTPSVTGPWRFNSNNALILPEHLEELYPNISLIKNLNGSNLTGTWKDKNVQWSHSRAHWQYFNRAPVRFMEEEVTTTLDTILERLRLRQGESTLQNVPTWPTSMQLLPVQEPCPSSSKEKALSHEELAPPIHKPAPSTSRGNVPISIPPPTTAQQPTPPTSWHTPTMATPQTKALGMPPEPFDGSATKAENFLSALQSYYYLNGDLYSNNSKKVAPTLSHFKVGMPTGGWAQDRQNAALSANQINYGTWDNFIAAFRAHFIPVQTT
jgi:hypothetical protein